MKIRLIFLVLALTIVTIRMNSAAADSTRSKPLVLVPRPTRVFKTADRSHEATESWIFSLMVQTDAPAKLTPASMKVSLLRNSQVLSTTSYSTEGLKPLTYQTSSRPRLADGNLPPTPIFWPVAIRIRHTEPVSLGVNAIRIEVDAFEESGQARHGTLVVPVETYRQKISLIFPFRGKGIILQGGATNGGHRNRSGLFALDAFGLDESWSIIAAGEGKQNSDYRGWGRELISPADGVVFRLRDDRPDQPVADTSDPKYYAPEYKEGGDPGNYLVIDHGGSEFSVIAHFQAHSMLVKVGDHVRQGQALGKLGHSGDTSGPHCHYQLQAGPDWENADALPCKFSNVDEPFLDRGTYFEAK
jgi:murein DD-endopeptidase MepM/ murein hydrolase activator NlpD